MIRIAQRTGEAGPHSSSTWTGSTSRASQTTVYEPPGGMQTQSDVRGVAGQSHPQEKGVEICTSPFAATTANGSQLEPSVITHHGWVSWLLKTKLTVALEGTSAGTLAVVHVLASPPTLEPPPSVAPPLPLPPPPLVVQVPPLHTVPSVVQSVHPPPPVPHVVSSEPR
jgi:hypothetical protein